MTEKEHTQSEHASISLCLDNQVCFPLYSASNAIVRAYRPLLEKLDLTYSQYLVMMVLWENDGITVKALGEKLFLDSGTLTPLLKRLEKKALVERRRSPNDERARALQLTDAGHELKQKALAVPEEMFCKLRLPLEDLIMLKKLCHKVLDNLK